MSIAYQPLYGIEPYNARGVPLAADYGGGADFTQENLLVTLFEVTGDPEDPSTFTYKRIKPGAATASGPIAELVFGSGYGKQLRSRNACRFLIQHDDEQPVERLFLALLNPPRELAQLALDPNHLASALNPTDVSFNSTSPVFFSTLDWDLRFLQTDSFSVWESVPPGIINGAFIGNPIPIGLPFKTTGADGTDPVPYGPYTSVNDFVNVTNEIKNGAPWFIPLIFGYAPPSASGLFAVHLAWPHSGASRG
jgi:hypothetical protein